MKRTLFSLLAALCLTLLLLPTTAEAAVVDSGTCGENATWTLTSDGTLTISGTGEMANYRMNKRPSWFENRETITRVVIENGITYIGNYAFSGCTNLTDVTIADSVTKIGNGGTTCYGAFETCANLVSITIPDSVTYMDSWTFVYCPKLQTIKISANNPAYCTDASGVVFKKDMTRLICAPGAISGNYQIPDGVTWISDCAFEGCSNLTSVTVPGSVSTMSMHAFKCCTGLKSATICSGVTSIGWGAFEDNTSLTSVVLPEGIDKIETQTFMNCRSLGAVTLPASITSIERMAFFGCTSLTSISIPAAVTTIEESAFSECTSLKSISVDPANTAYCSDAFGVLYNKDKTTLLNAPGAISGVYEIAGTTTTINAYAFKECSSLTAVTIPANVTSIGYGAFENCSALSEVTFAGDLPTIDGSCFLTLNWDVTTAYYPCNNDTWTEPALQTLAAEYPTVTWKVGHSEKTVIGKATSCTEAGLTDGKKCTICGTTTVKQTTIPATGHKETTVSGKAATCTATGLTAGKKCSVCGTVTVKQQTIAKTAHKETTVPGKAATCTAAGLTDGKKCSICGDTLVAQQTIPATGHSEKTVPGKAATCTATGLTDGKKCTVCGTVTVKQQTIAKLVHSYKNGVCTKCSAKDPNYVAVEGVDRVYGASRYDTAFQSADTLKKQMGVSKFSCAIVTSGDNFADALAGSYLAYVKKAPILLTDNDNIKDVMAYIQENVEKGATIYALGGKAVVTDKLLDLEKKGYDVKRLAGKSRFETNLEILKECGSVAGKDILVCTGFNFADSLSASAAKRPILLVDDKLTSEQKAYLKQQSGCKYYIVGGTGAVTSSVEKSLKDYGTVKRLAGANRFETSVMVAETFFKNPTTAVLAYGYNFPDGLCAGPLAATINAPLILTATGDEAQAAAYAKEEGIKDGMVLGGPALINDKAVKKIFSMSSGDKIK